MTVVRVALPVPLRQHFDYLIDPALPAQVGCRVRVPFGSRQLVGIIWQLAPADGFAADKLKPVLALLEYLAIEPDPARQGTAQRVIEQALASMFAYTTSHAVHPEQLLPLHAAVVRAIASQSPEAARKAVTALLDDTDETLVAAVEA